MLSRKTFQCDNLADSNTLNTVSIEIERYVVVDFPTRDAYRISRHTFEYS